MHSKAVGGKGQTHKMRIRGQQGLIAAELAVDLTYGRAFHLPGSQRMSPVGEVQMQTHGHQSTQACQKETFFH